MTKIDSLNDVQKKCLLVNRFPTSCFEFPVQTFSNKSKRDGIGVRCCASSWFTNKYIAFSRKKDRIFCLLGFLFPTEAEHSVRTNLLINEAYKIGKIFLSISKNIRRDNIINDQNDLIYLYVRLS